MCNQILRNGINPSPVATANASMVGGHLQCKCGPQIAARGAAGKVAADWLQPGGGGCACAISNCVGIRCDDRQAARGAQRACNDDGGQSRRSGAQARTGASAFEVVKSGGVVVCVGEQTIDAVEAAAGVGESFNDASNDERGVVVVVVAESIEACVAVDEHGGERVERPSKFADRRDRRRQVSGHQVGVVAKIVTGGLEAADRGSISATVRVLMNGGFRCAGGSVPAAEPTAPLDSPGSRALGCPGWWVRGSLVDLLLPKQRTEQ